MNKLMIFIILSVSLVGCGAELLISPLSSVIVGGVITWKEGEAHKYYNYKSDTLYRAVVRTADELNYPTIQNKPGQEGDYTLIVGNNDKFKIKVKKVEEYMTLVSIRVNLMGDKPYAILFYEKLDEQVNCIEYDIEGKPVHR